MWCDKTAGSKLRARPTITPTAPVKRKCSKN